MVKELDQKLKILSQDWVLIMEQIRAKDFYVKKEMQITVVPLQLLVKLRSQERWQVMEFKWWCPHKFL